MVFGKVHYRHQHILVSMTHFDGLFFKLCRHIVWVKI